MFLLLLPALIWLLLWSEGGGFGIFLMVGLLPVYSLL
jgi:hypothetical protein